MKGMIFLLSLFLAVGCRGRSSQAELPYLRDSLRIEKEHVDFGEVYFGDRPRDTIMIRNISGTVWEGRFDYNMHYLLVKAVPYRLEPGETGRIIVELDTELYGKYETYAGRVVCMSRGGHTGMFYLPVTARIKENFTGMSEEEKAAAPVAEMDSVYHFGRVKAGEKVEWKVRIKNKGKQSLILRNIKTSCGCTVAEPDCRVIAGGEEGWLSVVFKTDGRQGRQHKTIEVTLNDYRRPRWQLTLEGEVVKEETIN